ncbi:recombination regulator RecX, partial [Acinetobacter baumannii]
MNDSDAPEPGRKRRVREQTPVQRALGLLVRREHSRKELTRKLTS